MSAWPETQQQGARPVGGAGGGEQPRREAEQLRGRSGLGRTDAELLELARVTLTMMFTYVTQQPWILPITRLRKQRSCPGPHTRPPRAEFILGGWAGVRAPPKHTLMEKGSRCQHLQRPPSLPPGSSRACLDDTCPPAGHAGCFRLLPLQGWSGCPCTHT